TSTANSGSARISIEPDEDADLREMLEEVQRRVDAITTFPGETERPRIYLPNTEAFWEIANVVVYGDLNEDDLLKATHQVRDDLLARPEISQAAIWGNRKREIAIEADPAVLQSYGLTLQDVTDAVRRSSIDLSAGAVRTSAGRVLLRTRSQAYTGDEFRDIILRAADGAEVRLGEVARISDGFESGQSMLRYNGRPALRVEVLRSGKESAIEISDAIHDYAGKASRRLPDGVGVAVWDDESISLRGRLSTLGTSLAQGAFLVLLVLGLFLRPMLAFWVVIGIPISFAGGLLLMPYFDMTINMMSLFGFIIVVGIVVDDAIVTGENIYTKLREGMTPLEGAVEGTKEVAVPVTFGVITTVVAFVPLMFFDGFYGNFARQIPPVVAGVLLFSLVESKLILPSHLKHLKTHRKNLGPLARFQKGIADSLERFVERVYKPLLGVASRHRYTTLSIFLAAGLASMGLWFGGYLGWVDMPNIDRYRIDATIDMPDDTPFEETDRVVQMVADAAAVVGDEFRDSGNGTSLIQSIMTASGAGFRSTNTDENYGSVGLEIVPPSMRTTKGPPNIELERRWRELIEGRPESRYIRIHSQRGSRGRYQDMEGIEIELRGPDSAAKNAVADELVDLLESFEGQIANAWTDRGRRRDELEIRLKPRARELRVTERDLATQVRNAFFGAEAQRIQRDREEIRVMIRMPEALRDNMHSLESLKVSTGTGAMVPFSHVATAEIVQAPTRINRIDGARAFNVFAQPEESSSGMIEMSRELVPEIDAIVNSVPGLSWRYDGFIAEHEETSRQNQISWWGLILALYALLAIPFRSLLQPIFVLLAIPFGIIGALIGHLIMDITPSWLSVFGMMALAGVVVNDSLVMVDFTNRRRREGVSPKDAVLSSGAARFRPILLTSLTTFAGLMPLILDRSIQAQFLIPMAISLAFGILFATVITLFLIPCAYLVNEDIKGLFQRAWQWYASPFRDEDEASAPELVPKEEGR
ncbi:MAG: efflux RND transporter permease subunit, partial [Akkermansiaceae bacterium]|nr:efflux RND transporter permease subunit [Akkermansiaceae bacterium]